LIEARIQLLDGRRSLECAAFVQIQNMSKDTPMLLAYSGSVETL
jgi:hypothetical protein